MPARARIAQVADPGSWRERGSELGVTDPLGFVDSLPYPERLAAAAAATGGDEAMLAGRATIVGRPVVLTVMEFGFLGGSMGAVVGERFAAAASAAADDGIPLVSVACSGGARMQEGVIALLQMAKTVAAVDELREAGVPFVSVLTHPTTGGVAASFAALGDVLLAEPGALLCFSGPRVVRETTRERLPEDFGRAESSHRFGHVDLIVPRDQLRGTLARLVALLGDCRGARRAARAAEGA
jgi:acetyl-CoA carboxylase carboxyl transferase subunit beta